MAKETTSWRVDHEALGPVLESELERINPHGPFHANDAVVTASVAAATTALYARAGINLQAAIQQAMGQ